MRAACLALSITLPAAWACADFHFDHEDVSLKRCEVSTGEVRWKAFVDGWLISMAVSSDGKTIATAHSDGAVRFWDAATGQTLRTVILAAERRDLRRMTFSPDLRLLFEGGRYGGIPDFEATRLWDLTSGRPIATLETSDKVSAPAFSTDSRELFRLVNKNRESEVKSWDIAGRRDRVLITVSDRAAQEGSLSPDTTRLALIRGFRVIPPRELPGKATFGEGGVGIIDLSTRRAIAVLRGHTREIGSVAWFPDRKRVATASYDYTVRIWNLATGLTLRIIDVAAGERAGRGSTAIALSPDGRLLLNGAFSDGRVRLWDVETGKLLHTVRGRGRCPWRFFRTEGASSSLGMAGHRKAIDD